jgi:mannosyl-oligosaccharide alpha-1,2-mannosidase
LSQLTKDPKYYDAVQRITNLLEKHENKTKIPGLFPVLVSPLREEFDTDKTFTFGGMADSLYEYFSKQHMLLGGLVDQYRGLHERAIDVAKEHIFFRPLNPQNQEILLSGTARITAAGGIKTLPDGQHLACFTGGMVGIGAKIFNRTDDLDVARKLVDGCIWAYDSMPTGIMPETFTAVPCTGAEDCTWRVDKWNDAVKSAGFGEYARQLDAADIIKEEGLAPGFARINDRRFLLRYVYALLSLSLSLSLFLVPSELTRNRSPEAIESVFILYRITGDTKLQDAAWRMFSAINNATMAQYAHSAIADVTVAAGQETQKLDQCESFWLAETLKYFYLIFSEPGLVSLDEFVL